ncbi:uncharacterized protein METZ01_LOCUS469506, partial [marine metagenome]
PLLFTGPGRRKTIGSGSIGSGKYFANLRQVSHVFSNIILSVNKNKNPF